MQSLKTHYSMHVASFLKEGGGGGGQTHRKKREIPKIMKILMCVYVCVCFGEGGGGRGERSLPITSFSVLISLFYFNFYILS